MAQEKGHNGGSSGQLPSCDAYFETLQSRKKLPHALQAILTSAFEQVPVSSFPQVPGGQVVEIPGNMSVAEAVKVLSEHNITSAPVRNHRAEPAKDWRERYLGIIDYSAIILWVLESAEVANSGFGFSTGSATAAGVGAGTVGAIGAVALGMAGPAVVAGLTVAAAGAAMVGGTGVTEKASGKDAATTDNRLGEDFYKVILQEEPFKSTTVEDILKSYRWAPFIPVAIQSSMLSVLLLLSKYRLRNVPVIKPGEPDIKNFITQSAIVNGLEGCKGRDWFDSIASHPISDLGLPFMSPDKVVSVQSDELILEAFKRMRDNKIGGLPVVSSSSKKIVGNISIRDIRHLLLKPELFTHFRRLTVMDFMNTMTSTNLLETRKMMPPLTCKADSFLGTVIHMLASKSVHRIYVVSDEDRVMGVITLRDVISCFIFEPPHYFNNYLGFSLKELLSQ